MRVLAVGSLYPPHHLGGYEVIWLGTTEHLRACGHEVHTLVTTHREPGGEGRPEPHPEVHRELDWYWSNYAFPPRSFGARLRLERHNHAALEQHLTALRPDLVMWWAMGGLSLSLVESVTRRGIPSIGVLCDDWLDYGPRVDGWLAGWNRRRARPFAGLAERVTGIPTRFDADRGVRWLCISEMTRRRARERGGWTLADSAVCHSGINPDRFVAVPPREGWEGRLLYAGRLDPRKGIATAIDALGQLGAGTTLDLVGTGLPEDVAELRCQAQDLGVSDRIRFREQVAHDELAAVYAAADALLFPVVWEEPWGLVPIEAMSVGTPVIATGTGGSGEYLRDGDNCLLFPPGDAGALTAAIVRLAGDPALRARLREGGAEPRRPTPSGRSTSRSPRTRRRRWERARRFRGLIPSTRSAHGCGTGS